jgi:hypothetical protein
MQIIHLQLFTANEDFLIAANLCSGVTAFKVEASDYGNLDLKVTCYIALMAVQSMSWAHGRA